MLPIPVKVLVVSSNEQIFSSSLKFLLRYWYIRNYNCKERSTANIVAITLYNFITKGILYSNGLMIYVMKSTVCYNIIHLWWNKTRLLKETHTYSVYKLDSAFIGNTCITPGILHHSYIHVYTQHTQIFHYIWKL